MVAERADEQHGRSVAAGVEDRARALAAGAFAVLASIAVESRPTSNRLIRKSTSCLFGARNSIDPVFCADGSAVPL